MGDRAPVQMKFRHFPYSFDQSKDFVTPSPGCAAASAYVFPDEPYIEEAAGPMLPEGTVHTSLYGAVPFIEYPHDAFHAPNHVLQECWTPDDQHRLFMGQLPWDVTEMQLNWLCYTIAGVVIRNPERIVQKRTDNTNRSRRMYGGLHVYCNQRAAGMLIERIHKRVLIDNTGVWYAQTEEELNELQRYIEYMKQNAEARPQKMPRDSVVVEYAHSTFVPKNPVF